MSYYELEAKPGTRFAHTHGDELLRQSEALEGYFERVVEALTARLSLVRDGELLPRDRRRRGRDLRARHNLAYSHGRDYVGIGIGAVSTVGGRRWRNAPSSPGTWLRSGAARRRRASTRPSETT